MRQDDGLAKEAVEWLSNNPDEISHYTGGEIMGTIELLDRGVYRIAEPDENADRGWRVNQWLKQAILLSFKLNKNEIISGGPGEASFWYDKVPSKFSYWDTPDFEKAGFRAVPPCAVRFGAYIGRNVVLMPSLVNIGGYVDDGTMVDTWATVGSCAQIGKNVHLSGGVGIGGVLEPLQANPTIIEDGAFIGARSEVVEGVIVRRRAVLSMGVFIGKNTPIVDRTNGGNILYGEVPENAVVMMGVHPKNGLTCPQIVKYRDEKTDAATAINEILRG
ncbi:MAG: 2,3,4,5-tetrahydropyridine-2,6-dicarboxylate N-succinyltransferase [Candidatus Yonathbacteria bacterium RIFOXYD1_FULL_52_36]|uniref:2,3,4,5-tetrahydropyridine-2,6-dicarboxylate N-succinyltransferase n=1 Tax=Candidatus Yonathbacteria bacterium RIFOXYD1_FULL_52_36 TaxID=1802730 RepID=A0A1G2SM45_9BACT|nr:MAG: 2,3,4,5-tetrahydropyridine-2,6-dicarboxylate N-succinyltransferase [Candidatus Yonathbacteria bacterium RIFOXYD1_FULL_52_36]